MGKGIVAAIFAIFGGRTASFIVLMIVVSVISIVPIIYSYVIFKKLNEK